MRAYHGCPFTTMDQTLITTILHATTVKTYTQKCFRCGGFDHLVDGCPFPQAASLEMAEMMKKDMQLKQKAKTNPFKSTIPTKTDKSFHN